MVVYRIVEFLIIFPVNSFNNKRLSNLYWKFK